MLEIKHLRLVQAIAEEGGPTRAGVRLHLSQSAVSHQLADLERRLDVLLFVRERKRLQLTSAGARLLALARKVLPDVERAEREVRDVAQAPSKLRVCTECFTGYHWLPAVVPRMRAEFPNVDLSIDVDSTQNPLASLKRGRLDCAVMSTRVRDAALRVEPLFDDEWVVILAPSDPLAQRSYVRARDLVGATVFAHHPSKQDAKRFADLLEKERTQAPSVSVVPLTEALVALVAAGLGVGLVSRWAVAPHERAGTVAVRRFTKTGMLERWSAVFPRDTSNSAPILRIIELLRAAAPPVVSSR